MAKSAEDQMRDIIRDLNSKIKNANNTVSRSDALELGETVVLKMKNYISKGISPLAGETRFPAYLHQGDKTKYPENQRSKFPNKRSRPVNLKLSGQFMDDLQAKTIKDSSGYAPEVGYFTELSKLKEQGHREGANGQPKRPTIPSNAALDFNTSIRRYLIKYYTDIVNKYFRGL